MGTPLDRGRGDIPSYSAGHTKHEWTSWAAMEMIFADMDQAMEGEGANKNGKSETADHKDNDGGQDNVVPASIQASSTGSMCVSMPSLCSGTGEQREASLSGTRGQPDMGGSVIGTRAQPDSVNMTRGQEQPYATRGQPQTQENLYSSRSKKGNTRFELFYNQHIRKVFLYNLDLPVPSPIRTICTALALKWLQIRITRCHPFQSPLYPLSRGIICLLNSRKSSIHNKNKGLEQMKLFLILSETLETTSTSSSLLKGWTIT